MTATTLVICIILAFSIAFSSCFKPWNSDKKLLIDTDAGGDDAVAIIMAVMCEKLDDFPNVIGITCVNGNADVDDVAMNVLKTLQVVNRLDIPVYKGASHPLLLGNKKDNYFGRDGFGDFYYPNPPSTYLIKQQHAVNAMISLVKKYPGEIILVALGPLTNVALALRIYPMFVKNLRKLVIMGGSTEGIGNVKPGLEFNFHVDPIASYIVLNSSTSNLVTLVPWETVLRTRVTLEFRKSLSKSNNKKVWLIDSAEAPSLNLNTEYWNCADAVAITIAMTSGSIVTKSETYYSEAIYDGTQAPGVIVVDYTNVTGNPANTNLIHDIDVKIHKDIILRSFGN